MKVWANTGFGMTKYMEEEEAIQEGYDYTPVAGPDAEIDGVPALGLNNRILTPDEQEAVQVQLGKRCDTWDDVKKALGTEHRLVEPGDKVDRELKAINEQKAIDLEAARR